MPAGNSRAYRGHRGTQAATNAARESTTAAEETPEPALGGSDELMEAVAGTVSRTADAAVDITQRVADQGRETIAGPRRGMEEFPIQYAARPIADASTVFPAPR